MANQEPHRTQQNRFLLIDGLRGIAAIAVAGFHFYSGGPLRDSLSKILPAPLCVLLEHGSLGVEIFFVISGFIIAYSLRKAQVNLGFCVNFVLRRSLRLDPPYWATIALVIVINWVSNFILSDRSAPIPGWGSILAHVFYLQNLLELDNIVPVFWTLCLEVQFYLFFIIYLGITQWLVQRYSLPYGPATTLLVLPPLTLSLVSLAFAMVGEPVQGFFLPYWYMFFMGVMLWWVLERKVVSTWFWSYTAAIAVVLVIHWDMRLVMVLATGCIIYLAAKLGQLHNWLSANWLQELGKISYSLYLVHTIIGMRVINIGYRVSKDVPIASLFWFLLAFATSITTAYLMYFLIEKPSIEISKRLKLKISQHTCCN